MAYKKAHPAPNTLDRVGTSNRIEFKDYIQGDYFSREDTEELNRALSYYESYYSAPKHSRSETYEVLDSFKHACDAFIRFLELAQDGGPASSAIQRIFIEYVEIKSLAKWPDEIIQDLVNIDTTALNRQTPSFLPIQNDEIRSNLLYEMILYRHAASKALSEFDKEGDGNIGGRPSCEGKVWLEEILAKIFKKNRAGKVYGREKRWQNFVIAALGELPETMRPTIGSYDAISKRMRQIKQSLSQ